MADDPTRPPDDDTQDPDAWVLDFHGIESDQAAMLSSGDRMSLRQRYENRPLDHLTAEELRAEVVRLRNHRDRLIGARAFDARGLDAFIETIERLCDATVSCGEVARKSWDDISPRLGDAEELVRKLRTRADILRIICKRTARQVEALPSDGRGEVEVWDPDMKSYWAVPLRRCLEDEAKSTAGMSLDGVAQRLDVIRNDIRRNESRPGTRECALSVLARALARQTVHSYEAACRYVDHVAHGPEWGRIPWLTGAAKAMDEILGESGMKDIRAGNWPEVEAAARKSLGEDSPGSGGDGVATRAPASMARRRVHQWTMPHTWSWSEVREARSGAKKCALSVIAKTAARKSLSDDRAGEPDKADGSQSSREDDRQRAVDMDDDLGTTPPKESGKADDDRVPSGHVRIVEQDRIDPDRIYVRDSDGVTHSLDVRDFAGLPAAIASRRWAKIVGDGVPAVTGARDGARTERASFEDAAKIAPNTAIEGARDRWYPIGDD